MTLNRGYAASTIVVSAGNPFCAEDTPFPEDISLEPEQDPLLLFPTERTSFTDQTVENVWCSEFSPEDDAAWSVATQRARAVGEWRIAAICRRETVTDWTLAITPFIARQIARARIYRVLTLNALRPAISALPFACGVVVGAVAVLFLTSGADESAARLTSQGATVAAGAPVPQKLASHLGSVVIPLQLWTSRRRRIRCPASLRKQRRRRNPRAHPGGADGKAAMVFRGSLRDADC